MTTNHEPEAMTPIDFAARIDRLSATIMDHCDALIVSKPVNLRWLTGFASSNMAALLAASGLVLVTDNRYVEALEQQVGTAGLDADVRTGRDVVGLMLEAAIESLSDAASGTVGLESRSHHLGHAATTFGSGCPPTPNWSSPKGSLPKPAG